MKRYCFTLDLADDPQLIAEYKRHHQNIWPEITQSIRDVGVERMEIYVLATRLFMIMEVDDQFTLERKEAADRSNPRVQEWEQLMWKFQRALPQAKSGEKWVLMEKIFDLDVPANSQQQDKRRHR
jgi:L-rhamnose mutarotase